MKGCSTSYVIRELQIKTTMRWHYVPLRMAKIQASTKPNADSEKISGCQGSGEGEEG